MTSLVDALLVYAEPLAAGAHAVVVGDSESVVAERLLDLGARSVLVFDPDPARAANVSRSTPRGVSVRALVDDFDVRDGTFDLAVVPDIADLNDPRGSVARLRRAVANSGAVVALGRAKLGDDDSAISGVQPFATELAPATLAYAELYDVFATQFEEVALVGVVPFAGVVFAQLGSEEETPSVSVDTRLAGAPSPSVFVIVATQPAARPELDPYAIVQVPERELPLPEGLYPPRTPSLLVPPELEAELAAAHLKSDLLAAQLEEARERLVAADARTVEAASRFERAASERDGALTRAMELEAVLAASQQALAVLERRLLEAEQSAIEREDRIATLSAEIDARHATEVIPVDVPALIARAERAEEQLAQALAELASHEDNTTTRVDVDVPDLAEVALRAQRAETALALSMADVAQMAEAHTAETAAYEAQLRERARLISSLEKELIRREQMVRELVAALEETREGANGMIFQRAEPLSTPVVPPRLEPAGDLAELRSKLDALAAEVARREGELVARAWRITELERELELEGGGVRGAPIEECENAVREKAAGDGAEVELARARDELDALRQALAQEHAARIAAESGEELVRARSELARQAALLEQIRGRAS